MLRTPRDSMLLLASFRLALCELSDIYLRLNNKNVRFKDGIRGMFHVVVHNVQFRGK